MTTTTRHLPIALALAALGFASSIAHAAYQPAGPLTFSAAPVVVGSADAERPVMLLASKSGTSSSGGSSKSSSSSSGSSSSGKSSGSSIDADRPVRTSPPVPV